MGYEVGQRVADYEIVGLLGVGGMGRVYRVRNVISHRTEAMKVLLADLSAEPDLAARFVSEIRTLAGLDHPNIAQLHTALQVGNELVMMMEFVDGRTLQQLAQEIQLSSEEIVDYIQQVLAALSFAHERGVVHRDIKPANIMVTPEGVVKLMDFGIAKSKVEDQLTRPGTTVGSLNYMSPEQAQGGCPVDGRSDIYSVGITLYELLAGCRPFEDESAYVILHSQVNVPPRPPIEVNPLISTSMNDLILKALEKDPEKRFQTAANVSEALRQAAAMGASRPVQCGAVIAPATGVVPSAYSLPSAVPAAATSRFTTSTGRKWWIAAEVVAVLGVLGVSGLGLPHMLKAGVIAKTVVHPTPSASFPAAPYDRVAVPGSGQDAGATPAEPRAVSHAEPDPIRVISTAPPGVLGNTGSASRRGQTAVAKLARVEYRPVSREDITLKAEGDEPASQAAAPARTASTIAELQQVREQKLKLDTRAAAVRIIVEHLKTQREAAGDGLSQDVAGAYVRMNAYLNAEKTDLEDADVAAARDHMEKAAYEVTVLENQFSK